MRELSFADSVLAAELLPLLVAIVCGAVLGAERQWRQRQAGLRTVALVTLGAAVFTLVSARGFDGSASDTSRVAAQIVSGVGFLGAGVILRRGEMLQGLNTAATLWTATGVGMAAACRLYVLAIVTTVAVLALQLAGRRLGLLIEAHARDTEMLRRYRLEVTVAEASLREMASRVEHLVVPSGASVLARAVEADAQGGRRFRLTLLGGPAVERWLVRLSHQWGAIAGVSATWTVEREEEGE